MTSRWKGKKSPPEVAGVNASGLKLISLNATHIIFQCYTVSIMRAESLQCNVKRYVRPVASMKAAVSSEVQTGLLQMECHLQSRPRRWRRREVVPRSYVPFSQLVSWWEERQPAEGGPILTPCWPQARGRGRGAAWYSAGKGQRWLVSHSAPMTMIPIRWWSLSFVFKHRSASSKPTIGSDSWTTPLALTTQATWGTTRAMLPGKLDATRAIAPDKHSDIKDTSPMWPGNLFPNFLYPRFNEISSNHGTKLNLQKKTKKITNIANWLIFISNI